MFKQRLGKLESPTDELLTELRREASFSKDFSGSRGVISRRSIAWHDVLSAVGTVLLEELRSGKAAAALLSTFPGVRAHVGEKATSQEAMTGAFKIVSTNILARSDLEKAAALLQTWVPADRVAWFGALQTQGLLVKGEIKLAFETIEIFAVPESQMRTDNFRNAVEGAIASGKVNKSYTTVHYGVGYSSHFSNGPVHYAQDNAPAVPAARNPALADLVNLGRRAELSQERTERALLTALLSKIKEYTVNQSEVGEVLALLPAEGIKPSSKAFLLTEAFPRLLTECNLSYRMKENLRNFKTCQVRLGVSDEELAASVGIALVRFIENEKFSDYTSLLSAAQPTTAEMHKARLGPIISSKVEEHLTTGDITKACDAVALLTAPDAFETQAKEVFLAGLRAGRTGVERMIKAFALPAEFLQSKAVKRAARAALSIELHSIQGDDTKGGCRTWRDGKWIREPSPNVQMIRRIGGLSEQEVQACARSVLLRKIRDGNAKAAQHIVDAFGLASFCETDRFTAAAASGFRDCLKYRYFEDAQSCIESSLCGRLETEASVKKAIDQSLRDELAAGRVIAATRLLDMGELNPSPYAELYLEGLAGRIRRQSPFEKQEDLITAIKRTNSEFKIASNHPKVSQVQEAAAELAVKMALAKIPVPTEFAPFFGLTPSHLRNATFRVAIELVKTGEYLTITRLAKTHGLEIEQIFDACEPALVQAGFVRALSFGGSPALWDAARVATADKLNLNAPDVEKALESGLRADIRAGDWRSVDQLAKMGPALGPKLPMVIAKEVEDVFAVGNPELIVAPAHRHLPINEHARIAALAALRALAKNDFTRVEKLVEVFGLAGIQPDAELRAAAVDRMEKLLALGWKKASLELVGRLFGVKPDDLEKPRLLAALGRGIEREVAEGNFAAVWSLRLWAGISDAEYASVLAKALPPLLRTRRQPVQELLINLDAPNEVSAAEEMRETMQSCLYDAYCNGAIAEAHILKRAAKLPDAIGQGICKEVIGALLSRGQFSRANRLLPEAGIEMSAAIADVIPTLQDDLRRFIERHKCKTIGDLIGAGRTYLEMPPSTTYSGGYQTKSYTGFKPLSSHGYTTEDIKLIDEISSSGTFQSCARLISLFRQQDNYTCGVAAARMAIRALTGREYSEWCVKNWLGTNQELGTPLMFFDRLRKELPDHDIRVNAEGTVSQLREALAEDCIVIINFNLPRNGGPHYAVVRGLSDEGIMLADPTYGWTALRWEDFNWCGGYNEGRIVGGYVALRPSKLDFLSGGEMVKLPANREPPVSQIQQAVIEYLNYPSV